MADESILTSEREDTEVFTYGAKHLEKGRIVDSDGDHIVDENGNKIKFFSIVEEG